MNALNRLLIALALPAVAGMALAQTPPAGVSDQLPLLASTDPRLAANKRLVFDMYRTVLNAGRAGEAGKFVAEDYIQHNPNVVGGRRGLEEYIRRTRPERAIPAQIGFPVVSIMAEGDLVLVATVSTEPDPENPGKQFTTTHFDLFRIAGGRIAEHWDNVQKSAAAARLDPNTRSGSR